MKKIILMLSVVALALTGCENDVNQEQTVDSKFEIKTITSTPIGVLDNGEFKLNVDEKELMVAAQNFSNKYEDGEKMMSYKVETIDGNLYLRFYGENETISTVAINRSIAKGGGSFDLGETVCKSTAYASGGGCVPNGEYCTPCRPYINPDRVGDCSRTTTGTGINPA